MDHPQKHLLSELVLSEGAKFTSNIAQQSSWGRVHIEAFRKFIRIDTKYAGRGPRGADLDKEEQWGVRY